MIGYLEGNVQFIELDKETLVLNVGGVGYELICPGPVLVGLADSIGKPAHFFIHTHVREDQLQLFGFTERAEKELFLALVKINGIGPKLAVNILAGTTVGMLRDMVESEDVSGLSKLPKVGKKKAEQMILSLKGKLVMDRPSGPARRPQGPRGEISSALVNLGYRSQDVEQVVGQFPPDIDIEEGVRKGLAALSGQL